MTKHRRKPGLQGPPNLPALQPLEERLERIETKLAYLEDFLTRLQGMVLEGNAVFERLQGEHRVMKGRLLQISQELETVPHEKPPHY